MKNNELSLILIIYYKILMNTTPSQTLMFMIMTNFSAYQNDPSKKDIDIKEKGINKVMKLYEDLKNINELRFDPTGNLLLSLSIYQQLILDLFPEMYESNTMNIKMIQDFIFTQTIY